MTARRTGILLLLGVLLAGLLTGPAAGTAAAAPGCAEASGNSTGTAAGQQSNRRPVVLVHGWTGSPLTDTASKLNKLLPGRITTFTFDYHKWSLHWASDAHIAACLAGYVNAVAENHRKKGGDGKVVVVTHSMGGLALRYATSASYAATPIPAKNLAAVITLGTPHQGSPWPDWLAGIQESMANGDKSMDWPSGAAAKRCLAEHRTVNGSTQALPEGCGGLPPSLPQGVRLVQLGGDITVNRTLFGIRLYSLPLAGDGIVPMSSATGYANSGPTVVAGTEQRSDTCGLDLDVLANGLDRLGDLKQHPELLLANNRDLDFVTALSLRAKVFTPPVATLMLGATRTAACGHGNLPVDQSAVNQVTEVIRSVLAGKTQPQRQSQPQSQATRVVTVTAVDRSGKPANGYRVDPQYANEENEVDSCTSSQAASVPDIAVCSPTAAGADVCWIGADRHGLLCAVDPWQKTLLRANSAEAIGSLAATPQAEPWAIELEDGARCRLRNGGSWGGRADDYVGAYYCKPDQDEFVLVKAGPTVNRSSPVWTVKVGPLGEPDERFPPPKTMRVVTAYLTGAP